jgi:ribosome-associated protein
MANDASVIDLRGKTDGEVNAILNEKESPGVFVTDAVFEDVSATAIRAAAKNDQGGLSKMVAPEVAAYIERYGLYKDWMSQNLKEKVLSSELPAASAGRRSVPQPADPADFDERIRRALHATAEKKAIDLTVLDLRGIATFTDYFIISTGANKRQMQAIADEVVDQLKRGGSPAARVEGYQAAEWILVDYGDFIVHVFDEKARRFYDLEYLWREAKRLDVSPELLGSEISNSKSQTRSSLKEE